MYKHPIRAPLVFYKKKFSRAYKKVPKFKIPEFVVRGSLFALYAFLLLSIDLVLFADSGNLNIFKGFTLLPELFWLLLILAFLCTGITFALNFSKKAQALFCAFITFLFVYAFINQFAEFDAGSFFALMLSPLMGRLTPPVFYTSSEVISALLLSIGVYLFLSKASKKKTLIFVLVFAVIFLGIIHNSYQSVHNQHEFMETADFRAEKNITSKQKFIYLMLPDLSSYKQFRLKASPQSAETAQMIAGFLNKNGFEVFENVYNNTDNAMLNAVDMLNIFSKEEPQKHLMKEMLLYRLWKFFNVNDEYIYLKENQMFDSFRKSGYQISAYKSQGVDICHKNNLFNVNRCVEKLNRPVNLYSLSLKTSERTKILAAEWLTSMRLFENMGGLFNFFSIFTKIEDMPMIGISYNNLYVVNSIKTLDILAENILNDQGRNAYFIYADIPSDMFIYDQFCTVKPRSEWVNLHQLPWMKEKKNAHILMAYNEQTRCLLGKLQEFLDRLSEVGLFKNTVVVIQGLSSEGLQTDFSENDNYKEDLLNKKLSFMAIKSPLEKKAVYNKEFCTTKTALRNYLYGGKTCENLSNLPVHQTIAENIKQSLNELSFNTQELSLYTSNFTNWYKYWQIVNNIRLNNALDMKQKNIHTTIGTTQENVMMPELKNEILKKTDVE